jgi:hypothetical protein
MTKAELQNPLAEATQTDKRIGTLSDVAYKEIKKNGAPEIDGKSPVIKGGGRGKSEMGPATGLSESAAIFRLEYVG